VEELETFSPEIIAAARGAVAGAIRDPDFVRLDAERFAASPSISIDRAVMERTKRGAMLPVDFDWSDAGTWSALWEVAEKDGDGNVHIGAAVSLNATDSYLRSEGPLLAAVGVDDLIVVAATDAVLVARKSGDQLVSSLVELLKNKGVEAAMTTPRVHRPWGFFEAVDAGQRFQVKRITVNPGARLSLQKHRHRAEHWVVVNGQALVTRDDEQVMLRENESIFLPRGCIHRLENPGTVPLNLIEVQSGDYLGEDDIVRIEDDFGRVPKSKGVRTKRRAARPIAGKHARRR
jgi:mannose-1-phosphate guanylyltransferase/mannose-6-phosphate isomerase